MGKKQIVSLATLQEMTVARMLEPRTSENRVRKNIGSALRAYKKQSAKFGFTAEQIEAQVKDIRDMYVLRQQLDDDDYGVRRVTRFERFEDAASGLNG